MFFSGTGLAARELKVVPEAEFTARREASILVTLFSEGNENVVKFSLEFDPARVRLIDASPVNGPPQIFWAFNEEHAAEGRIGMIMTQNPGLGAPAGEQRLVRLRFNVLEPTGWTGITFGDDPVTREAIDIKGAKLSMVYTAASIFVQATPPSIVMPPLPHSIYSGFSNSFTFLVSDPVVPAEQLLVSAESLNPSLLPDSALKWSGTGAERILTITTTRGPWGTAAIAIRANNRITPAYRSDFQLVILPDSDEIPFISNISNRSVPPNLVSIVDFKIRDQETLSSHLKLNVAIGDPSILPADAIRLTRAEGDCSLSLTPVGLGTTTVTITVMDERGHQTFSSFLLTVQQNQRPIITTITNQTVTVGIPCTVDFSINDQESPPGDLAVRVTSSAANVLPLSGITLDGTGTIRAVTMLASEPGDSRVVVVVTDPAGALTEAAFNVTAVAFNFPPEISRLTDVTMRENISPPLVEFTVSDKESVADQLVVTAEAANPDLIKELLLSGQGSHRILAIAPAINQFGATLITVSVTDGINYTRTKFKLTVTATDNAPRLGEIPAIAFSVIDGRFDVLFSLVDADTPLGKVKLTAISDQPALLPASGLVFGGGGSNRILTLIPAAGQRGVAQVTIFATDGTATVSRKFTVTIRPPPDPPSLVALITPERNASFIAPGFVPLEAQVAALEAGTVSFFANELKVGEVLTPPYWYVWTNASPGDYALTALVAGNQGAITRSAAVNIKILAPEVPGDHFIVPTVLVGTKVAIQATNTFATVEAGEPLHANKPGGRSLWWSWVAPASGVVSVSTFGSNIDTLLAVYTGTTLTNLQTIASNDDDPDGGSTSRLTFTAIAGAEYLFAIDAFGGETGLVQLELHAPPLPSPPLKIEASGKNIVLSWPTNLAGFTPESSDTLLDGSWSPLAQTPVFANGQYSLKINAATGIGFFRLHRQ